MSWDCPDAAYFGPNILEDSDVIDMLEMSGDDLHLVSVVNHRLLNASIYGSVAVLKSARPTLSKTHMSIRATSLGVTSFDFPQDRFVTWAFTRTPAICEQLDKPWLVAQWLKMTTYSVLATSLTAKECI